jgi:predicted ATPase/class 3 adenylate cyclase/DNA-binding CsgD family transcriptional regulator
VSGPVGNAEAVPMPAGVVTFLLTDVAGSTRLWEDDRHAMARAISRHYEIIDEQVNRHAGVRPVEQGEGDSTVAAFARASDAIRAALGIQRAILEEPWPDGVQIAVRIGIHTGEADHRGHGNYAGPAVIRCARVRALGHGGQTVLTRATADIARDDLPRDASLIDLGEHPLRDLNHPEHIFQLSQEGVPSDFPPLVSSHVRANTLPAQVTSFVGREHEMDEIRRLLEETRLLTLVGAGGCGKTRLAIEVAEQLQDCYRDGALWVDLSSLSDPALVASTVANALKLRWTLTQDVTDTVAAYLSHRNMLLLLDNCEHLAAACASFAERVVRACAETTIIATSREPLGVPAETTWRVPSLSVPSDDQDAEQCESVRLFLERARKSRPQLRSSAETLSAVAAICRRLDGIPLAIELAAARVRTMSPQQIAAGIGDRFSLLGGGTRTALPRQRTLEASVDWSFNLLGEPERILFRRLAIFAGGFSLDAAEHVCADDGIDELAVLDVLSQLVDRSLVQTEDLVEGTRYRLLETVRAYARQKLADSDEGRSIRDRHLAFFVEFLEKAAEGFHTPDVVGWVDRTERDHDNIRAAIDWSIESQQTDEALRFGGALFYFALYGNHLPETRRRLDAILSLAEGDPALRGRALASVAAAGTFLFEDPEIVRAFAEEAVSIAREVGDKQRLAQALGSLAFTALYGDARVAVPFLEEAIAAAGEAADRPTVCLALVGLVIAHTTQGEELEARNAAERALAVARPSRHPFWLAQALCWEGFRAVMWGEFDSARSTLDESIALSRDIGDQWFLPFSLAVRGYADAQSGRVQDARRECDEAISVARPAGLIFQVGTADLMSAERSYIAGDPDEAIAFAEEALAIFRLSGYQFGIAVSLNARAWAEECRGERDTARRTAEEALEVARSAGLPRDEARALVAIARVDLAEGSIDAAEERLHEALGIAAQRRLSLEVVTTIEHIAKVAAANESFEEAARLLGAAHTAREDLGYPIPVVRAKEHDAQLDSLRAAMGDELFNVAWKDGAALTIEGAVAYATRARGERKRPSHGWASLTPTELDVVRLVQQGLTNPQIAQRMFISKNTVMTHLSHVFSKLGVKARAELASEATRRGL